MMLRRFGLLFFLVFLSKAVPAADRPNVLWITSEDNASHWIGCYGNRDALTPRIDAMAARGLKFTHAYSNGPVCAVARSTLLNGAYAVSQGTQHMRSRHPIPAAFKAHVTWMQGAGYYCTNQSKTDYNFKGDDAALWDDCSPKAHYRQRPDGKPFFAVINLNITHESQLFPKGVAANRKKGEVPPVPRLDPAKLTLPPHLPDLPEVRADMAVYHDCISAMDRQVGVLLDELKQSGAADDTIVFYFSDHGGAMARGKRYLQDTGVRVPLVIHFPEKWQHLSPFAAGTEVQELVSFVDFAPTLLSLGGVATPAAMQGRAFLGTHRATVPKDPLVYLFADRFDDTEGMRRAITNGRFKYIRCFTPHLAGAPYSSYALGQPSWVAWQKASEGVALPAVHAAMWKSPQPVEMLFDTAADPWEIQNLAGDPGQMDRLTAMRAGLHATMVSTVDSGLVPEPLWPALVGSTTIHDYVHQASFSLLTTLELAWAASASDPAELPRLIKALASDDPVTRYWGATGCLVLAKKTVSASIIEPLRRAVQDEHAVIRFVAAQALIASGAAVKEGEAALLSALQSPLVATDFKPLVGILERLGLEKAVPAAWVESILKDPQAASYRKDYARKLKTGHRLRRN